MSILVPDTVEENQEKEKYKMGIFTTISAIVTGVIKPLAKVVDDVHTSDEERLTLRNAFEKMQVELISKMVGHSETLIEAQKAIIIAEAQGSWLQRNWRPLLMLGIVFMLMNNYVLVPYLSAIFGWSVLLEIPVEMWNLLTYGLGGYVGGRSLEKIMTTIKGKK